MRRLLPLLFVLLIGCEGMALHEAELADSPAVYEAFLQKYPSSAEGDRLRGRIEKLRFLKAKEAKEAAALREFLSLHPDGEHAAEAKTLEDGLSYTEASKAGTAEALQAYLDSHPDGASVEDARRTVARMQYLPGMSIAEVTQERVNMAGDEKGELNGWRVEAQVTNGGDRTLSVVEVSVDYLDAKGGVVQTDTWWAVTKDLGGFPVPPHMEKAMPKGTVRPFKFSTAERPEGFADQFALRVTEVRFRE
jgi:hypothetical protein